MWVHRIQAFHHHAGRGGLLNEGVHDDGFATGAFHAVRVERVDAKAVGHAWEREE